MRLVSQSTQDTRVIAAKLAKKVLLSMPGQARAVVIALRGDLGAGKTVFAQGFAQAIGVMEQPKSPTFTLAKRYAVPKSKFYLWHLDCYRVNGRNDLVSLDLHILFENPHNIILIEWPERMGDGLPREHIEVHLDHEGDDKRAVIIKE